MGQVLYPSYADKVERVADDLEDDAKVLTPSLVNSPWLIIRNRQQGTDPGLRTMVAKLAYCTHNLFMKILDTTIAHLANVMQETESNRQRKKMTRDVVRAILGEKRSPTIRPTFGPLICRLWEAGDSRYLYGLERDSLNTNRVTRIEINATSLSP
jgi:hypothetical protein